MYRQNTLGILVKFSTKLLSPDSVQSGCIVVGAYEDGRLTPSAQSLDRSQRKVISELIEMGDLKGTPGTSQTIYLTGRRSYRIVVAGLGKKETLDPITYRKIARTAILATASTNTAEATLFLTEIPVSGHDDDWKAMQIVQIASECMYAFDDLKSKKSASRPLRSILLAVDPRLKRRLPAKGIALGKAISAGVTLARDLGNLPGNYCTPLHLAKTARNLARDWKLRCEILEREDAERLGMGSFLSVTRGSRQPPKFIVLSYRGASNKSEAPIVLIGKGITFDTGGISLKPGAEMDEMKFDMCGAASVLGTMRSVAEMELKLNLICIVPATENMPDGAATKPGDIVTSLSGQTIEILNTDAEGRLILADALTYAERYKPQAVIDVATLTGACVIALGHVCSAVFSPSDKLAAELIAAGEHSHDRTWRLPLWDEYQDQLKSNFADMANIGGRAAGSVTAACFLSRFAAKFDWAHLDIAGIAWNSGKDKGATGRPVGLLTTFLMQRANGV